MVLEGWTRATAVSHRAEIAKILRSRGIEPRDNRFKDKVKSDEEPVTEKPSVGGPRTKLKLVEPESSLPDLSVIREVFISSAGRGAEPCIPLLERMKKDAKEAGAEIILMENGAHNKPLEEWNERPLHPLLYDFNTLSLNDKAQIQNVMLYSMNVKPQIKNPTSGVEHLIGDEAALVVASPKQTWNPVASSPCKLPKVLASPGSVTLPKYLPNAPGQKAEPHHQMGFLRIKFFEDGSWIMRNVQADLEGNYRDLEPGCEAMVLGDIHLYQLDPIAWKCTVEQLRFMQPKRIVLHDLFDGHSINGHEQSNVFYQRDLDITLGQELDAVARFLLDLQRIVQPWGADIVVAESNHNEWISRLISKGDFSLHSKHFKELCQMGYAMCEGHHPLEWYCETRGVTGVRWLRIDEEYRVAGVALEFHGHDGSNGSRGSFKQLTRLLDSHIQGHEHGAKMFGNHICVGTLANLRQDYNSRGLSNWTQTNSVLYRDGSMQMLHIVNGRWR